MPVLVLTLLIQPGGIGESVTRRVEIKATGKRNGNFSDLPLHLLYNFRKCHNACSNEVVEGKCKPFYNNIRKEKYTDTMTTKCTPCPASGMSLVDSRAIPRSSSDCVAIFGTQLSSSDTIQTHIQYLTVSIL